MVIIINEHRQISELQREFSEQFPYLRLQFYERSAKTGKEIVVHYPGKTVKECRTIHTARALTITPSMTVADIKRGFSENYGLFVQVLRQSGRPWLDTTLTEMWTLEQQNQQGKELSA